MIRKNLIVIGSLWGDEGKGKIIDALAPMFSNIVRSQGGDNAGHTIVVNEKKYKLRLLPSGCLSKNKTIVIAQGVALNLETLIKEINLIKNQGFSFDLKISDRAHIVMPYHIAMDELLEEIKGEYKVGTTKRGIGPCYEDKVSRTGIRTCDLLDKTSLLRKIELSLKFRNPVFKTFAKENFDATKLTETYYQLGQQIKQHIANTGAYLQDQMDKDKFSLFEGAQGVMLCLDNGTYPYVTSSSPTAASICLCNGIRQDNAFEVLGITKAYISRVGEGPFPTIIKDETIANHIIKRGNEFGTVTQRPRKVGWTDLVLMKHSVRVSSINSLAITLIDVLSGLKVIKVCTKYIIDDKEVIDFPASIEDIEKAIPVYEALPGWSEEISHLTKFEDFPKNCQNYIRYLEEHLKIKVKIISNGADRKNTIIIDKNWKS